MFTTTLLHTIDTVQYGSKKPSMFVLNYWQLTSFIYFSGHAGHRTSRKSVEADQGHEDLAGIQGE